MEDKFSLKEVSKALLFIFPLGLLFCIHGISQSDLQTYTPSKLLESGRMDFKWYNNFYTQTRASDASGTVGNVGRSTFFTSTGEMYYGVSPQSRINIGVIANFKTNSFDTNALDVFRFEKEDYKSSYGLSNVALSFKWSPFPRHSGFSLQSSFYFPVFKDNPKGFYLDRRSNVWENKFYYDKISADNRFQLFTELDITYIFGDAVNHADATVNNGERFANNSVLLPVSLFLSYFPTNKTVLFVNGQQYTMLGAFNQEFTLAGLGFKYQLTAKLNMELSSAYFLRGHSTGLGETYNLGLRYIL